MAIGKDRHGESLKTSPDEPVSVKSLSPFQSPTEEYLGAFEDSAAPFLYYYATRNGLIQKQDFTRGQFMTLALRSAARLCEAGISKGDRVVHCFSVNSSCDLIFRLAAVMVGSTPVTINWQADDNERIVYKLTATGAKACLYDEGFAERIEEIKTYLPGVIFLKDKDEAGHPVPASQPPAVISYDDERIIVFTSGTTAKPKGVSLSHRSYLCNRLTFESYFGLSQDIPIELLLVNPLHHTNSTALSDWALRRRGAVLHLVESYTTDFWKILKDITGQKHGPVITALVSRHIDFLDSLVNQAKLPLTETSLRKALYQVEILIGSAPVGPKTIESTQKYAGRIPHVRFGSTETCLEVMAIPFNMPRSKVFAAFKAGWSHQYRNEPAPGYYIGRAHAPFTEVMVVKSVDPDSSDFMNPCNVGEPGYLITRGDNLFSHYVGGGETTASVMQQGWYTGLRDIAFTLGNEEGNLDYYWASRDSEMLIRGGANYSYLQIAEELTRFVVDTYILPPETFQIGIVGLKENSEHEDSCYVTIELIKDANGIIEKLLRNSFLHDASKAVPKGSRPDYLRFARIPKNFKGAILFAQLKQDCLEYQKDLLKSRP